MAGEAEMIDVGLKERTARRAVARGALFCSPAVLAAIRAGAVPKGDPLAVARVAGILAAKRTPDLLPLCHPIALTRAEVQLAPADDPPRVEITAEVQAVDRTGVEMEALTAVAVAALTVYDMCKGLQKEMEIGEIRLELKEGGRSGTYRRPGTPGAARAPGSP